MFGAEAERGRWMNGFAGHSAERSNRFASEILAAFDGYRVPTIVLGPETTRWSVRVHGGPGGRSLSDQFREAAG